MADTLTVMGAEEDGRTTRWEHRDGELLAAATQYVLDHGVASLTMRPLAEAVGVTITTLIRRFGSKDALVQQICRNIHANMLDSLAHDPELHGMEPRRILDVLWNRWLDPAQARQFAFLFELGGVALRDSARYRWFTESVIADWLSPIQDVLVAAGMDVERSRIFGTVVLSLLRGLHMDYAMTGDRARVDAAYRLIADQFVLKL